MKDIISRITLEQLEQMIFRLLQNSFSKVMADILGQLDAGIAEERDKKRFYLKGKRPLKFASLYGEVALQRNYYQDRETGKYVYLLDRYLAFDGTKGISPAVKDLAIELAVTGVSYRQAEHSLENLLGYPVVSHEGIRQQLLNTEVTKEKPETLEQEVLFVEVDGLYTKRQGNKKKGKEEKMAAVHQGWEMNGTRAKLIKKRHYIHKGKEPFWEGFETFLMHTYDYDPMKHHLVINGDGASWITACRDHFRHNATYVIDRFHVAKDIRTIFKGHSRCRAIQKKQAAYDAKGLLLELNSASGTLDDEKKEEHLERLINQLSQYPEALRDYRERLREKGINTEGFRPMGSAEGTMSVFAKRLKQGRSWSDQGMDKFIDVFIALKDKLEIKTLQGKLKPTEEIMEENKNNIKPSKRFMKKLKTSVMEATRGNIMYLNQAIQKPTAQALKGLRGF